MSEFNRLHHIALGAQDVHALATFYAEVFGLERAATHHHDDGTLRSIWLRLGPETVLMIEPTPRSRPRPAGIDAGPFLLAFHVDPTTRDAFEAEMARRGIAIEDRSEQSTYTRDPENNRIAVSHYPLADAAN